MEKKFSTSWVSSIQPRKQRKYRSNAPLHLKQKMAKCRIAKPLRSASGKRSTGVRVGDKVKICRGQYKGQSGKIERVIMQKQKVYVTGIDYAKKDGSKSLYPIDMTNLIIEEMQLEDKKRSEKFKGIEHGKKSS